MGYNVPKVNPMRQYPYLAFYKVSEKQYIKDLAEAGFTSWVDYAELKAPRRQTRGSAGYDLYTPVHITLKPGERKIIPLGIKVKCEVPGSYLEIHIRSSIGAKLGCVITTGVCIIDSDYYDNPKNEGNISLPLYNLSNDVINIPIGWRIAQGIFKSYFITDNDDVGDKKRTGGFGSTGK